MLCKCAQHENAKMTNEVWVGVTIIKNSKFNIKLFSAIGSVCQYIVKYNVSNVFAVLESKVTKMICDISGSKVLVTHGYNI